MYLIDTSIWIDYLREQNTSSIKKLTKIFEEELPFGLTNIIYQEILQGAASEKDFKQLITYFGSQRFFYPKDGALTYQAAAKLYFDYCRQGVTVRSTIACLIAQIAIENKLVLLHNDKDFIAISKIAPSLMVDSA
jgi:predicted nucleic acid-binding protein